MISLAYSAKEKVDKREDWQKSVDYLLRSGVLDSDPVAELWRRTDEAYRKKVCGFGCSPDNLCPMCMDQKYSHLSNQ